MKLKSNIDSVEVVIFFNEPVFWLVNKINKMSDKECHFCCVKKKKNKQLTPKESPLKISYLLLKVTCICQN